MITETSSLNEEATEVQSNGGEKNDLEGQDDNKEESISARPREVKFIDFQSARISSLVTDILAFTFTSLSSTLRREHIYQLLEVRLFFQRPIEYSELNLNLKSNFLNTSPQWNAYIIKKDKRIFL